MVECEEGVDDAGIELVSALVCDLLDRFGARPGGFVGPFLGECVVDVGDGDDASGEGDLLALDAVGIAGSVLAFVVGEGDLLGHA